MNIAASVSKHVNALHSGIWLARPKHIEWLLLLVFGTGLPLYAMNAGVGQIAADLLFIMLFVWLVVRGDYFERYILIASLLISAAGEGFLSLIWGLYDYKFHTVPFCVPPGHALFMMSGVLASRKMPECIAWLTPLVALPFVIYGLYQGTDTADIVLYLIFTLFIIFARARRFYATMFIFSLILEIVGTRLGVWAWRPIVPGTGFTSSNPPLCAGSFYCMLDFLVLGSLSMFNTLLDNRAGTYAKLPQIDIT